ncbi:hypothetical protein ACJJTC_015419 [Scirpophaga incertulas]
MTTLSRMGDGGRRDDSLIVRIISPSSGSWVDVTYDKDRLPRSVVAAVFACGTKKSLVPIEYGYPTNAWWRLRVSKKDAAKCRSRDIGVRGAGLSGRAARGAEQSLARRAAGGVTSEAAPGATVCHSPATRPHIIISRLGPDRAARVSNLEADAWSGSSASRSHYILNTSLNSVFPSDVPNLHSCSNLLSLDPDEYWF